MNRRATLWKKGALVTARLLDGKSLSKQIQAEIRDQIAQFTGQGGGVPCLAAVLVGADPASEVYVRNKQRACERVGVKSQLHRLEVTASTEQLLELVERLNQAVDVHGILVQLPLPETIDVRRVLDGVYPLKDVDAFHPENCGLLFQGRPRYLPCTPRGIQELLLRNHVALAGRHVVIVGRSEIVGKSLALMLLDRGPGRDATVTVCHSKTRNLAQLTRGADVLVAAVGRAKFITADMVRPGAVVVDVGINRIESGIVGDVDFQAVREVAGLITPVPGGVGPLTVTMLLANTLAAARLQCG